MSEEDQLNEDYDHLIRGGCDRDAEDVLFYAKVVVWTMALIFAWTALFAVWHPEIFR